MRSFSFFCVIFLTCVCFGCGGSSTESNANTVEVTNSNPANSAGIVPYTPTNGNSIDANAANLSNANQAQVKVVTPPANAKPMTFPAPDDSEYSSTMDKTGAAIERRVFHNDPQLVKVEKVWKGVNDKTISIYLKNGKVVKLPGDKIENINSQPASVFLDAAGVKPTAAPAAPPAKKQ
jgi:hypothetical protein